MRLFLAALALARFHSFAQSDQAIYSDALANAWQDWSGGWATVNLNNASPAHSGSKSASVAMTGAWQGFYLHHDPQNTATFSNLTFWVNGGTSGGQLVNVQATRDQSPQTVVQLSALPTNSWRQISLPLAALGVSNVANLDGFWIQDRTGGAQPTFFVDDIKLVAYPPPAVVQVSVNATQTVRTVDARWFAVNAAVWDSQFDTANTSAILGEMGCQALRFPGGSLSDEYHWASNKSGTNSWTWWTSFDAFAHIATNLHAQTFITVNYGSGTALEASNWVRYANITRGCGFKYWEIGNENYGDWETDTNTFAHDPFTYATRAKDYLLAMKGADPTIKVGVVAVTGEDSYSNGYTSHPATNPRTSQAHNGWTPVMLATLKNLGVTPDFLIYHRYAQNPLAENDANLLASSLSWTNDAGDLRQQLTDYLGTNGAAVELICTENNSVSFDPGKQTTSLVNALFLADSLGNLAQTEFNSLVWWDLRNGEITTNNNSAALYGWRPYGNYGLVNDSAGAALTNRYPAWFAFKLLKNFARGGDRVVRAASDYPLVSVFACQRTNGAVTLLAVNKSPSNTFNTTISLNAFAPHTNGTLYTYGPPQDDAARTGVGSPDITQTNFAVVGTNFTLALQAYSLTVLSLPPAAPRLSAAVTNGQLRLKVTGQPGGGYAILRSSNFTSWSTLTNVSLSGSFVEWTEASPANAPARFYRAAWLP
ncbi:MAG: alpha-L-arabinofuranosidase [Pedosphaera sp.]|nr:alpha-L-arabinofuranosidase [Pedosphaera sp.]